MPLFAKRATAMISRLLGAERVRTRDRTGVTPQRIIHFPPDVADKEWVRTYLLDTPVGSEARMEIEGYVSDALDRFRVTMALLPELQPGARVLELGAGPYFLTRLMMRRGLDVTCANWFGADSGDTGRAVVERTEEGKEVVVDYDLFNVENDRFPYEDDSFDLVLCCEILEHLPADPINMLAEIHRVLRKETGTLLLTTPNAVRMMNLVHMLNGDNVYEQYSGYGAYGRHNREFTVEELRRLLGEAGYRVNDVFALDVHPNQRIATPHVSAAKLTNRGDNLFALATPFGRRRWSYHDWIYSSQQAIEPRVVQPHVVIGENGYLQTRGLYSVEHIGGDGGEWASWTGYARRAYITLSPTFSGAATLIIEGISAPAAVVKPVRLFAAVDDQEASWQINSTGEKFEVKANFRVSRERLQVQLWTDTTFVPAEASIGDDRRSLGVALIAVKIQPLEIPRD